MDDILPLLNECSETDGHRITRWFQLGQMYHQKPVLNIDILEARKWFGKAAAYGHTSAIEMIQSIQHHAPEISKGKSQIWFQLGLFHAGFISDHQDQVKAKAAFITAVNHVRKELVSVFQSA